MRSIETVTPGIDGSGRFPDTEKVLDMSLADHLSSVWKFLFARNERTPHRELPRKMVDLSLFNNAVANQLKTAWLGHSSLLINIDGYRILTDPVFEKKVSIIGPSRFNGDVPLDIDRVPDIDAVVISHDHYDHLNKYSVQRLMEKTEKFVVPLGVGKHLMKWGVPQKKIIELGWWQEYQLDTELTFVATPSQHFSGRTLTDRNKTLWASWVIMTPNHKVFFSGDSGYFNGFSQVGEKYGPFDMTFLECGAYNRAWAKVHMFPEQTLQAHLDLRGKILHPIHWGTFNLSLHPWYEPMERLTIAADLNNVRYATPVVGDTTIYGQSILNTRWWNENI